VVGGILIVITALRHKAGWLIVFQFSQMPSPPQKWHKK
jgi:hypothetical protein